eukprot:SAG11_NODE_434_length_9506_cov_5.089295_2_plen_189_part_00
MERENALERLAAALLRLTAAKLLLQAVEQDGVVALGRAMRLVTAALCRQKQTANLVAGPDWAAAVLAQASRVRFYVMKAADAASLGVAYSDCAWGIRRHVAAGRGSAPQPGTSLAAAYRRWECNPLCFAASALLCCVRHVHCVSPAFQISDGWRGLRRAAVRSCGCSLASPARGAGRRWRAWPAAQCW